MSIKAIHLTINDVSMPEIKENEVLVKVKSAGVNPVDILIANGSIRLVQDYIKITVFKSVKKDRL